MARLRGRGDHSSGATVTGDLNATNPDDGAEMRLGASEDRRGRPYSVLLRVGLAMPLPLPAARCALTAPFHPYLGKLDEPAGAVYFLWRFP